MVQIFITLILFSVSVPVLSEQITLTAPAVSVAISFLMSTFSRASFIMLSASDTATMAGRPSGTAATTSTIPEIKTSITDSKLAVPLKNRRTVLTIMTNSAASAPIIVTVRVRRASF